jgi:DNA replication and repair protein RecF
MASGPEWGSSARDDGVRPEAAIDRPRTRPIASDDVGEARRRAPGLAVTRLSLSHFRCYPELRLAVDPGVVVLTGPNGAGKTNILEAISFLAPGRGLRRARLVDVDRLTPGGTAIAPWAVAAAVATAGASEPTQVGTGRDSEGGERRLVRIDGKPARGQAALARLGAVQWLTPQMDGLFLGGAGQRRRFFDRLVCGFDPDHSGRLAAYDRASAERSRLLDEGKADAAWLDALEDTMARYGVAVAAARRDTVQRLNAAQEAAGCGEADPFPGAGLRLIGALEAWLDEAPALAVEDRFRDRLAELRRIDAAAGVATEGPHRSDLDVRHLAQSLPAKTCSTGEQKALLIAIQLANARLLSLLPGGVPLLLLDEIAAHLDARRREALFAALLRLGCQAWMTGTDASLFRPLAGQAQFMAVTEAVVGASTPPS